MKNSFKQRSFTFWLVTTILVISLGGCGFKLRGSIEVPAAFQTISLKADPSENFTKALIEQLKANSIKVSTKASTQIDLKDNRSERRTVSYSGRGKSAEYELLEEITFEIVDRQKNITLRPETKLQTRRTLIVDDTKLSATKEQERIMRREMESDLASKLLRTLQKQ
ncbi:MAG: LPS assembly lipoprotein LptE [Pseudomonadales bacterium]|nr:LPS assembly lipoprotein LptE [Pseudomonadales bacterium]